MIYEIIFMISIIINAVLIVMLRNSKKSQQDAFNQGIFFCFRAVEKDFIKYLRDMKTYSKDDVLNELYLLREALYGTQDSESEANENAGIESVQAAESSGERL